MNPERVTPLIRHATSADVDAIVRIFSGPKAVRGTLQLPYPSRDVWRKRLEEPERGLVSLLACVDDEPVGILGIHGRPDQPRLRHSALIGMTVRDDWHGRGIGTALLSAGTNMADNWLQLTRLELHVFVENTVAIRLYEKFGFQVEGTMRRAAFCDGQLRDILMMARLR
jgi:putative acetyltransferase